MPDYGENGGVECHALPETGAWMCHVPESGEGQQSSCERRGDAKNDRWEAGDVGPRHGLAAGRVHVQFMRKHSMKGG